MNQQVFFGPAKKLFTTLNGTNECRPVEDLCFQESVKLAGSLIFVIAVILLYVVRLHNSLRQ